MVVQDAQRKKEIKYSAQNFKIKLERVDCLCRAIWERQRRSLSCAVRLTNSYSEQSNREPFEKHPGLDSVIELRAIITSPAHLLTFDVFYWSEREHTHYLGSSLQHLSLLQARPPVPLIWFLLTCYCCMLRGIFIANATTPPHPWDSHLQLLSLRHLNCLLTIHFITITQALLLSTKKDSKAASNIKWLRESWLSMEGQLRN